MVPATQEMAAWSSVNWGTAWPCSETLPESKKCKKSWGCSSEIKVLVQNAGDPGLNLISIGRGILSKLKCLLISLAYVIIIGIFKAMKENNLSLCILSHL